MCLYSWKYCEVDIIDTDRHRYYNLHFTCKHAETKNCLRQYNKSFAVLGLQLISMGEWQKGNLQPGQFASKACTSRPLIWYYVLAFSHPAASRSRSDRYSDLSTGDTNIIYLSFHGSFLLIRSMLISLWVWWLLLLASSWVISTHNSSWLPDQLTWATRSLPSFHLTLLSHSFYYYKIILIYTKCRKQCSKWPYRCHLP